MNSPNPTYTRNKWLVVNDGIVWNIVDESGLAIQNRNQDRSNVFFQSCTL